MVGRPDLHMKIGKALKELTPKSAAMPCAICSDPLPPGAIVCSLACAALVPRLVVDDPTSSTPATAEQREAIAAWYAKAPPHGVIQTGHRPDDLAKFGRMAQPSYEDSKAMMTGIIEKIRQRVINGLDAQDILPEDKLKLVPLDALFKVVPSDTLAAIGLSELVLELVGVAHEETVVNMLKAGAAASSSGTAEPG